MDFYACGYFSRGLATHVESRRAFQAKLKELFDQDKFGKSSKVIFFKVNNMLLEKREERILFQANGPSQTSKETHWSLVEQVVKSLQVS